MGSIWLCNQFRLNKFYKAGITQWKKGIWLMLFFGYYYYEETSLQVHLQVTFWKREKEMEAAIEAAFKAKFMSMLKLLGILAPCTCCFLGFDSLYQRYLSD